VKHVENAQLTFADLFAGIGGIRIGFERAGCRCIWSNDNNKFSAQTYVENFGAEDFVLGDITKIEASEIPEFDILCAGFPCQPFSIAGVSKKKSLDKPHGFKDETQGTLFYDILRIIRERQPQAFFLENVRNLERHDRGRTFRVIQGVIGELGYSLCYSVINAKLLVPQNRERIFMVGFRDTSLDFSFPDIQDSKPRLGDILKDTVSEKYTLKDHLWEYLQNYAKKHRMKGNGFGFGLVEMNNCARTLSARYYKDGSEILVPQLGKNPRRLTPRECARLQGFPDSFSIPVSDTQAYKQLGNSVAVPVVEILARTVVKTLTERPQRQSPYIFQEELGFSPSHNG
jgi:DNA (cytosine-5)-methyltransferase 1